MKLSEFAIGAIFTCSERRWRCTDIGTRTVVAIALDHEDDQSWYNGPPYALAETVFDEDDREGCELDQDASSREQPRPEEQRSGPHPADQHALNDWFLYGPKDGEIADLVSKLAGRGLRLAAIEDAISQVLRDRLVALDAQESAASAQTYDPAGMAVLRGLTARRPWQLMMTGDNPEAFSSEMTSDFERVFERFPSIGVLTVRTTGGSVQIVRDFASGSVAEVDRLLAKIFRENPDVAGVTFPARDGRAAHTATPDDPFWSAEGKKGAEIMAAVERGEITPGEAAKQITQLYGGPKD